MDLETMKKKNLDSAILFMQQEHSHTLKGLHEEISNLQKRCSELTFQVAMSNTSISQEDELKEKSDSLGKELSCEQRKVESLETETEQKSKRIKLLEQMIKSHDHKLKDVKESHRQNVQDLQSQLNAKSDTVALLNTKLHQLRQAASQHKPIPEPRKHSRNSSASSSTEESPRMRQPAPPKDGSARHRRRSSTEYSHMPIPPPVKPPARLRGTGRRLPEKPQTPEHIPDPTPFLSHENSSLGSSYFTKRERSVLPPISHSLIADKPRIAHKSDSFTFVRKSPQTTERDASPEVEVETLAMSPATQKEHRLRRAQDYNSSN